MVAKKGGRKSLSIQRVAPKAFGDDERAQHPAEEGILLGREDQVRHVFQLLLQRGEEAAKEVRHRVMCGQGVLVRGVYFDAGVLRDGLHEWKSNKDTITDGVSAQQQEAEYSHRKPSNVCESVREHRRSPTKAAKRSQADINETQPPMRTSLRDRLALRSANREQTNGAVSSAVPLDVCGSAAQEKERRPAKAVKAALEECTEAEPAKGTSRRRRLSLKSARTEEMTVAACTALSGDSCGSAGQIHEQRPAKVAKSFLWEIRETQPPMETSLHARLTLRAQVHAEDVTPDAATSLRDRLALRAQTRVEDLGVPQIATPCRSKLNFDVSGDNACDAPNLDTSPGMANALASEDNSRPNSDLHLEVGSVAQAFASVSAASSVRHSSSTTSSPGNRNKAGPMTKNCQQVNRQWDMNKTSIATTKKSKLPAAVLSSKSPAGVEAFLTSTQNSSMQADTNQSERCTSSHGDKPKAQNRPETTGHSESTHATCKRAAPGRTVRELKEHLLAFGVTPPPGCLEKNELQFLLSRVEQLRNRSLTELQSASLAAGGQKFNTTDDCIRFLLDSSLASALPSQPARSVFKHEDTGSVDGTERSAAAKQTQGGIGSEVDRILNLRKEDFSTPARWGFAVLDVSSETAQDVAAAQRAYRTLMRKLHPDKAGGACQRLAEAAEMAREAREAVARGLNKEEPPGAPTNFHYSVVSSDFGCRKLQLQWEAPRTKASAPVRRYIVAVVDPAYGRPLNTAVLEPDYNALLGRFVPVEELTAYMLAEQELQKMPKFWQQTSGTVQVAAANDTGQSPWTVMQVRLQGLKPVREPKEPREAPDAAQHDAGKHEF
eukprot:TRINITY_DN9175_c0_g2_i1.p1 TRINITY_DN9175_c0_g2~~TRINITY_DN9175_c0_g2_i1.p1  ORF type:complete len:833 (-),score=165.39 TRINITY_DN9175_c0_g2_i1:265-2763(-)